MSAGCFSEWPVGFCSGMWVKSSETAVRFGDGGVLAMLQIGITPLVQVRSVGLRLRLEIRIDTISANPTYTILPLPQVAHLTFLP